MPYPLTVTTMLRRSRELFGKKEIVTRDPSGIHRYTYADFYRRTARLAHALEKLGVGRGDRVATFAWNHHRHLEAYFAIPCMGAVIHTINTRLFPDQFAHIVNHAEDKILLLDEDLIPAVEEMAPRFRTVKAYVVMSEGKKIPPTRLSPVFSYEDLLASEKDDYDWPTDIDENAMAGLCYTSATTGNPKGVPYTHRGIYLHALMISSRDALDIGEDSVAMTIVPMFHAAGWGIPYAATWMGAKQVFPGARPDASTFANLFYEEKVTMAAAVPTVWRAILQRMEEGKADLSSVKLAINGGSAPPVTMMEKFEREHGVPFVHAYGMTEAYPVVLVSRPKSYLRDLPTDRLYAIKAKQGTLVPGLDMKVVGEGGQEVPRDGRTMGELQLRGPWITEEYFREPERTREAIRGGWYCTGDVVTVDEEGYVHVQDRTRDLIKSGGEWISSLDLKNAIMAHPDVLEAAVIAVPHEKWLERPLACVVPKPGKEGELTEKGLLDFLTTRVAKWWLPDEIVFVDVIPKTSVGKFAKRVLREKFRDKKFV